jgi:hypothetical protein
MNLRLIATLKKIIATYSIAEIQKMAQGIINQFFPEVEMPEIKIVNHTFPTYVGITRFRQKKDYAPTIVVELQKSILDDERTLHRTLAHELIHVWQYSNADIREKLLSGAKSEDHGKSFNLMADKMNAVYGENYITKTSDATDIITQEKEFYILIQPHKETNQSKANKFGVTKFTRPSKAQKAEIQKRLLEQGGHVFKTKEKLFSRSADLKPFGGYSIYKDEVQDRLSEIYSGPNQDKLFLDKNVPASIIVGSIPPEEIFEYFWEVSDYEMQDEEWNWGRIKGLKWDLKEVPLSKLVSWQGNWKPQNRLYGEDEKTATYYADEKSKIPPVIVKKDGSRYLIIDGEHRSRAAFLRGDDKIQAYVGSIKSITSDFKTAKKKFLDANIPVTTIDEVLKRFKKLRDQHRIEKDNEKNIDYWSTKQFEELVDFVTDLESTPSKTKLRKAPWKMATPDGATKVAENDSWVVYKIDDFEASEKLGTRNWCISRSENHYASETAGMVFYFLLSKTRSYDEESKDEKSGHIFYKDDWHRIALQVTHAGKKTFWYANDDSHINAPDEVINSVPSFIIEKPEVVYWLNADDLGEDTELAAENLDDAIAEAERIIEDIFNSYDRPKKTIVQTYRISVNDDTQYRGHIEIEGEWATLRKEIKGYRKVGYDGRDAKILEFNGTYYFSVGGYEDDEYIGEIDEDEATLFLFQWGEVDDVITWEGTRNSIILYQDNFYYDSKNDYAYKRMLHDLNHEDNTSPESTVELNSTELALTTLYEWDEKGAVYFNHDLREAAFELTSDGGYYQVDYKGDIDADTINIIDFTKLTEEEFKKLSTETGWKNIEDAEEEDTE